MSDLIQKTETELSELFKKENGILPVLEEIEKFVKSHVFDFETEKGRKDAKALAYKVSLSKTLIEKVGKSSIEDLDKIVKRAREQSVKKK